MKTEIKKGKGSLLNKFFCLGIFGFVFLFAIPASAGPVTVSSVTDTAEYITAEVTGKYTLPADGILPGGFVYAVYSTDPTFPGGGISENTHVLSAMATGNYFTIYFDGLASGETYYYKVMDFGTTYATGEFTTLSAEISIGDTVTVVDNGEGMILIEGTYNKGPATPLPGPNYFISAIYGPSVDSLTSYSSVASTTPSPGYELDTHGTFLINIPVSGLTAGEPYYFRLRDLSKTYYSIDPDTGEAPFFEVDPDNVPDPITLGGTTSTVDCDGEDGYCLLAPIGDLKKITPDVDFGKYVNTVLGVIIGISGAIAVVMFVVAGIQYMASDVITSKSDALRMINRTLSGLGLLLGAFILLRTINPDLVDFKFALKKVDYTLDEQNFSTTEISVSSNPGFSMNGTISSPEPSPGVEAFVNNIKTGGYSLKEIKVDAVEANSPSNKATFIASKSGSSDISVVVDVDIGYSGVSGDDGDTPTPGDAKTPIGNSVSWIDRTPYVATSTSAAIQTRDGVYNMGAAFVNAGIKDSLGNDRYIGFHGADNNTLKTTVGCIRMYNDDLIALAPYMKAGTKVTIY